MFTTGQLTKKIGIETNTMIRWLREGIIVPEPSDGRNKSFSFEEALVGRAVAPLYTEWALKADLLAEVAAFIRDMLSIRKDLGYADHETFLSDISIWRGRSLIKLSAEVERSDEEAAEREKAIRDTIEEYAEQRGFSLPANWSEAPAPEFEGETAELVKRYETFFDSMMGADRWFLFVARNAAGDWHWAFSSFETFREKFQTDATSFIAVDLAKALAD